MYPLFLRLKKIGLILTLGFSFIFLHSCIDVEDFSLTDYDGALSWEQITDKAEWSNRLDHEVAVLNDELYLCGGYNPGVIVGDPYCEDVWKSSNGKDWTNLTQDAPWLGRRGHTLLTFDDGSGEALFLIGGFSVDESSGERKYNNDVWKSSDGINWVEIKSTSDVDLNDSTDWTARMHHQCVVANHGGQNYIYLLGGYTMTECNDNRYGIKYFNDVWRSTDGINWSELGISDYGIRAEFAMTVDSSGTLYIQGGKYGIIFDAADSSNNRPIQNYYSVWQSSDGQIWTESPETIASASVLSRSGHEMVFYKDKLWALPGKTSSVNHYHFTNSNHYPTWTLDLMGKWEIDSYGTAIDARHNYAAIVWKNKIWVLGGNTNCNGQDNDIWAGELK